MARIDLENYERGHSPRGIGRWLQNRLAAIAGYDVDLLDQCEEVERRRAAGMAAAIFAGTLIHAVSMAITASAAVEELWISIAAAAVTAYAFAILDRATIMGVAQERGLRMLRKNDAADRCHLDHWFAGLKRDFLRVTVSVLVSGGALAAGVTLWYFDDDIRAQVAVEQIKIDAPYRIKAEATVNAQGARLLKRLETAQARADATLERGADMDASRVSERLRLSSAVSAVSERSQSARERISKARDEYQRTEKLVWCEETGTPEAQDPGCVGTTGRRGCAERCEAFKSRLTTLAAIAEGARREIEHARTERSSLEKALANHDAEEMDAQKNSEGTADRSAERVAAISAELAHFEQERPERVAALIAAAPGRQVLNPDSLYQKIHALWVLSTQSSGFFVALIGIKAALVSAELIAFIAASVMPSGGYEIALAERHRSQLDAAQRRYREEVLRFAESDRVWRSEVTRRAADDAAKRNVNNFNFDLGGHHFAHNGQSHYDRPDRSAAQNPAKA